MITTLIIVGSVAVTLGAAGLWYRSRTANEDDEPGGEDGGEAPPPTGLNAPAAAKNAGTRLGHIIAQMVIVPTSIIYGTVTTAGAAIVSHIPFVKGKFWKGMLKFSAYRLQDSKGADAVNLVATQTGFEPSTVEWQDGDGDDEERGWKEHGTERVFHPGAQGASTERFGKADVILTDESAPYAMTPAQLNVAEALDLEQTEFLVSGADVTVNQTDMWNADPTVAGAGGDAGELAADGGAEVVQRDTSMRVHASEVPQLADTIIDLNEQTRISARKFSDMLPEEVGVEQLQQAEDRGYLAGVGQDSDKVALIFKAIALIGGAFVLKDVAPIAIRILFGSSGGGGGGGSLMPLIAQLPTLGVL